MYTASSFGRATLRMCTHCSGGNSLASWRAAQAQDLIARLADETITLKPNVESTYVQLP